MSGRLIDTLGDDSSDDDRTHRNPNRQIVMIPAEYREHTNFNINLKEYPDLRKGVKPTKTTAEGQWEEKVFQDEKAARMKFPDVPPGKIDHIRTAEQAERHGGEFLRLGVLCYDGCWLIGLDTEGGGATVQIASKEGGRACFQIWQLKSEHYPHCLENGPPPALVKIITHKHATFVGKDIQGDIEKLCQILELTDQQKRLIKTIELTTAYIFCRTLAKNPESLRQWVSCPNSTKDFSLKFIYNFSDEESTIDKRGEMRWRTVRWDESPFPVKSGQESTKRKGRPLNIRNKIYAVTDAEASRLAIVNIVELLRIRPTLFIQLMGSPYFLFKKEFTEVVDAFRDSNSGKSEGTEAANLAAVENEVRQKVDRVELVEFIKREKHRQFRILKKVERGETPHTPIYWAEEEGKEQDKYKGGFGEKEEKRLHDEREAEKWFEREREKVIEREKERKKNPPKPDEWDEGDGYQEVEEAKNEWSMEPRDIGGAKDTRQMASNRVCRESRQSEHEKCKLRSRSRTPLSRRSPTQGPTPNIPLQSVNQQMTAPPAHP